MILSEPNTTVRTWSSADVCSYIDDEMFSKRNTSSARYWDDPHTFKPSRFLKDWPRDAFLPFSAGERWFSPFRICLFSLLNMQEPVHALDESMWILLLSNQSIFYTPYLLFSHRFGETEGTAVLAMLVSHYKIAIKEEPQFASETFEERESRILSARPILSLAYVFFYSCLD